MFLGKVVGTVVSTQKDHKLQGLKLLLVQHMTIDMELTKSFTVVADGVGAGRDEVVVCAAGSSARLTEQTEGLPVDSVIMAIVDTLEIEGSIVFDKREPSTASA